MSARAYRCDLSADIVRELLAYDQVTGLFTWRPRTLARSHSARSQAVFNARFAGKSAFAARNADGYRVGVILGEFYLAHRVAWLHHYGEWPKGEIDHIDGDPENCRISNLRDVSRIENARNVKVNCKSITGIAGVKIARSGRWTSSIFVSGKEIWLGTFDTAEEAHRARKSAEREHAFHPNHGRAGPGDLTVKSILNTPKITEPAMGEGV